MRDASSIRWTQTEAGRATIWIASYGGNDSVRTLFDAAVPAGEHSIIWDGLDDMGCLLPEGVYRVHPVLDGAVDRVPPVHGVKTLELRSAA